VGRQLEAVDDGRLDIAALRGFLDRLRLGEGVIEITKSTSSCRRGECDRCL
jgi:hypothetical protein